MTIISSPTPSNSHSKTEPSLVLRAGLVSNLMLAAIASVFVLGVLGFLAMQIRPDAQFDLRSTKTIRVYCAAGVAEPIEQLANAFNQQSEFRVELARIGGSGELAGQIKMEHEIKVLGADLFISNDEQLLNQPAMKSVFDSLVVLAVQRPVIAVAAQSEFSLAGVEAMVQTRGIKFGIASQRAAVGSLARAIADGHDLLAELEQKKSLDAENVMVLAQALVTRSLDAAVIWDTTVKQINQHSKSAILKISGPADSSDQTTSNVSAGIVLGKNEQQTAGIQSFSEFLLGEQGRRVFESFGFEPAKQSSLPQRRWQAAGPNFN